MRWGRPVARLVKVELPMRLVILVGPDGNRDLRGVATIAAAIARAAWGFFVGSRAWITGLCWRSRRLLALIADAGLGLLEKRFSVRRV